MIWNENRIIGRVQKAIPFDVRLSKGVRWGTESELEGDCIANLTLFYLIFQREHNIRSKVAL